MLATTWGGHPAYTLRNANVELTMVPSMGARIVGLRDMRRRRDWIWQPAGRASQTAPSPGSSFEDSGHGGIDECLPTIGACRVDGLDLPDHGEAWSAAWKLESRPGESELRTALRLPVSGLLFTRTISLSGPSVRLAYALENPGPQARRFIWAWHPLLGIQPGDRLKLPGGTTELALQVALGERAGQRGERWRMPVPFAGYDLRRLALGRDEGACVKGFVGPLAHGLAGAALIGAGGESFRVHWAEKENPYCGLWLSRGYRGWHHVAIEPTNAPADRLDEVPAALSAATQLAAGETRRWALTVELS